MKIIRLLIPLLFVLIGFCGFIGGAFISMGVIEYKGELPLGDIKGIVVDADGFVYVGLGFYGKVQVYDSSGVFVRNWNANSSAGSFNIGITATEKIEISTARGDKRIVYNRNGDIISKNTIDNIYSKTKNTWNKFESENGSRYEISGGMFPEIKMTYPSENVIIKQGFFLQIMKGPFPAWLITAFGMGLLFLLNMVSIQRMQKQINKIFGVRNKK